MPIFDCYTLVGAWPLADRELSLEDLAAGMQARGVGSSLVTHTTSVLYNADLGNELAAELCAKHAPLQPVAVVDPRRFPACLETIRRARDAGVQAFRLCPREHRYPFTGGFGPLREALAHLEGARLLLVDLAGLPTPVIGCDLLESLPCPTVLTVDDEDLGTVIQAGKHAPQVMVEVSGLDAGGAIGAAVRHLGAERVLFGSRSPLHSVGSAVMSVQYAELEDAQRAAILEGNLRRILA